MQSKKPVQLCSNLTSGTTLSQPKNTQKYEIEIRVFSKFGRQQEFQYSNSNVVFSKKNKVGKMRKFEVMIPEMCSLDNVHVHIDVEDNMKSFLGLKKKIYTVTTVNSLEFNKTETNQTLDGFDGKKGFFFYLLPISPKIGRELGPQHNLRISFSLNEHLYSCTIDSIFLAGHKHESGKKKKIIQATNNNCIRITIDDKKLGQEVISIK